MKIMGPVNGAGRNMRETTQPLSPAVRDAGSHGRVTRATRAWKAEIVGLTPSAFHLSLRRKTTERAPHMPETAERISPKNPAERLNGRAREDGRGKDNGRTQGQQKLTPWAAAPERERRCNDVETESCN